VRFPVIPAKAGIQLFQILKNSLDSGFHRSDDFLREHQNPKIKNQNDNEEFDNLVKSLKSVTPAKAVPPSAGWIPAFAGMTK
jgi:hypothetical protein